MPKAEMPVCANGHIRNSSQAYDVIVWALYTGFDAKAACDATTHQEKIMAIALHYGDTLQPYKAVLKQAYDLVLYAPKHWPASHAWAMAGRWLHASGLQTNSLRDTLRKAVLLTMAHRIACAWFHSSHDDEWLQSIDSIVTQSWTLIENSFL